MKCKLQYSDKTFSTEIYEIPNGITRYILSIYNLKTKNYYELIFDIQENSIFENNEYNIFKLVGVK